MITSRGGAASFYAAYPPLDRHAEALDAYHLCTERDPQSAAATEARRRIAAVENA